MCPFVHLFTSRIILGKSPGWQREEKKRKTSIGGRQAADLLMSDGVKELGEGEKKLLSTSLLASYSQDEEGRERKWTNIIILSNELEVSETRGEELVATVLHR